MEEKIINEETEEVLENTASSIPEELQKYLEKDESTFEEIEKVLTTLDEKKESLEAEKEASEKSFDDRLAEFQEMLAKEKEDAFNEFAKREQDLDAEKARIEEIKLDEQGKQVNYIDQLKEISDKFNSKISSIEEAIKACEDNDTLTKALEEEKEKLERALDEEYISRKEELNTVLVNIGLEEEPTVDIDPDTEINLDFRTPEEIERDNNAVSEEPKVEVPAIDPNTEINLDFRTEEEKNAPEVTEIPAEPVSNEVTVDPAINDLLLRDFANNGITTVDEEPEQEEVTINPIEDVVPINEIVNEENDLPTLEEPKEETKVEDSVYKNDKKLSDIFKKKESKPSLETTTDYSNELDKILKKLNESSNSNNSTLDETQDFTNMF